MSFARRIVAGAVICAFCTTLGLKTALEESKGQDQPSALTYVKDVAPIVKNYCISCHGSDNDNPSELYMDDYEMLMKGGKHGIPVVAGKPDESSMYFKLLPGPPFGRQMPRGRKKITPEAVKVIHDWIEQGANEK